MVVIINQNINTMEQGRESTLRALSLLSLSLTVTLTQTTLKLNHLTVHLWDGVLHRQGRHSLVPWTCLGASSQAEVCLLTNMGASQSVQIGSCPNFISVVVRKYPDREQLMGEVPVHCFAEVKAGTLNSSHIPSIVGSREL